MASTNVDHQEGKLARWITSIRICTWSLAQPTTTKRWLGWGASLSANRRSGLDSIEVVSIASEITFVSSLTSNRNVQLNTVSLTTLGCASTRKRLKNVSLSREVIAMIPEFLECKNVLGIGEIGLNKNTRNEATIFMEHVDLAVKYKQQILIHTPHLEDKYQGTRMILDMLMDDSRIDRSRVLVDHVEEHTIEHVLENGFWAGMTLYPVSKCTPQRAADMIERYGPERLMANSAGDWGPSKPTAIPDLIMELKKRGHSKELIQRVVYENPMTFFSQSRPFVHG